jgi:hypothetical protein
MKRVMSTFSVLSLAYSVQPFVLECDASSEGIGELFMQNQHLISFESRKIREPKKLYMIYDKEMLAIMHALANFKKYLVGRHFGVRTDHNNLRYFLEQWNLNESQHKWVSKVQEYDFYIEYVKGNKNIVVDTLSKRPAAFSMTDISKY